MSQHGSVKYRSGISGVGSQRSSVAGSQRYGSRPGDSMVYHNSMFLKKLSNPNESHHSKRAAWREKLGKILESKPEQIIIFSLIVLDLLVICAQLFVIEPRMNCRTSPAEILYQSQHSSSHHVDPTLELWADILDYVSLGILGVLAAEIAFLLIAFDYDFFKQPLYILDALVIGASIFIEVKREDFAGSLLVFFRLWRIVRIVHGVAVSVQEKNEEHIKSLEEEVAKATKEKTDLQTKYHYLKKKYKKLIVAAKDEANFPVKPSNLKLTVGSNMSYETPPQHGKKIRIAESVGDEPSSDSDDDSSSQQHDSHVISINYGENADGNNNNSENLDDTKRPLITGPPVVSAKINGEYLTFKSRQ